MSLDEEVETILNGEGLEVTEFDSAPDKVKPVVLRKTVTYIVSALIFNSKVGCSSMLLSYTCILCSPVRKDLDLIGVTANWFSNLLVSQLCVHLSVCLYHQIRHKFTNILMPNQDVT